MADLLIKGMKMPDKLYTIETCRDADGVLQANCGDGTGWYDVVEVPEHGRLIDADKLMALMSNEIVHRGGDERSLGIAWAQSAVEVASTVLEASNK